MKLVISDSVWQGYAPRLQSLLRTSWTPSHAANDLPLLVREIADAEAVIGIVLPPEARAAARHLRLFQYPGAGLQHFKPEEFPAGCAVCNVYEHETPIAEYVMTAMLLNVTRMLRYSATFREGKWDGNGRVGGETHDELLGKTVGLVGYGHIGQAVAERARAFGMRIVAIQQVASAPLPEGAPQPHFLGGPQDLDYILANSDFVVIACPLSEETRGMLGAAELARIKPGAMLINVARAEIVQEEPLFQALREGRLASAALDVWYRYPDSPDQILHGSRLPFHELPNVMVTPHMSAWSQAMVERRLQRAAENLDRLSMGEPLVGVAFEGTWNASADP